MLAGIKALGSQGSRDLCCRAPRPLVLCSLGKLLAAGRGAAMKRGQNILRALDGSLPAQGQVWLAHENPGLPLRAFPENTKKSRKVFLKPVEFCIFTLCAASRYKRLFLNCLWRFLSPLGSPLEQHCDTQQAPSAFQWDQRRIASAHYAGSC